MLLFGCLCALPFWDIVPPKAYMVQRAVKNIEQLYAPMLVRSHLPLLTGQLVAQLARALPSDTDSALL